MLWLVMVLLIIGVVVSCGSEPSPELTPELTAKQKQLAIDSITAQDLVIDAAISQDGKELSLVVVINSAANEEYAKEVGDNFVRLTKSFGPEEAPRQEIGPGLYDYVIGVYSPQSDNPIVIGAKVSSARRIIW